MTTVYTIKGHNGFLIVALGHAEGSPEVCSAVSMMMTTAANWTLANGYDGVQVLKDGQAMIFIPLEMRGSETVYNLMKVGFEGLIKSYPEYIKAG